MESCRLADDFNVVARIYADRDLADAWCGQQPIDWPKNEDAGDRKS